MEIVGFGFSQTWGWILGTSDQAYNFEQLNLSLCIFLYKTDNYLNNDSTFGIKSMCKVLSTEDVLKK